MQLHQEEGRDQEQAASTSRLRNHKLSLTCVCIDSKDRHAFTGSKDGSIIKWCLQTRKIVAKINAAIKQKDHDEHCHTKHINCIAISSDDKFLASGGWDKHIRIWSPNDLTHIHTFSKHRQEVTALTFRQGHPMLYSGSADRSIMLWTLEDDDNRCYVESLYGHESTVTSMDALRRERVLSSGGRDQSIRIWKIVEQAQTVFESKHQSVDIARYIDDKTFVTGGEDGQLSVWTTMKRSPVLSLPNAHEISDKTTKDTHSSGENFDQRGLIFWISALATFSAKTPTQVKVIKRRKLMDDDENNEHDHEESDQDEVSSNEDSGQESGPKWNEIALVASGSCSSEIRVWSLLKKGSKYELKLKQTLECSGFVNDLRFTSNGEKLIAACGQEHKFGRWWKLKGSKNCMRVFDIE